MFRDDITSMISGQYAPDSRSYQPVRGNDGEESRGMLRGEQVEMSER